MCIFIDSTKNASRMFRYHPWLGRFFLSLTAILHRWGNRSREAFPRTTSGARGWQSLRKRSRTDRYATSGVFNYFFFFSFLECCTSVFSLSLSLSPYRIARAKRNSTALVRYLRYRQRKADARGNVFKLTLLVWFTEKFHGQYIRTAYKWMNYTAGVLQFYLGATEET